MTGVDGARRLIAVAAGCMVNARGEVLIAQRPAGKIAAGQWEFPGGKIEPGEDAYAALVRELHEELGVTVRRARPLIRVTHRYSDRTVVLDTWRVNEFSGEPQSRENQAFAWVRPDDLSHYPLLAADWPIVAALRLPADYVFTPPRASVDELLHGLERLPRGALLRLRQPGLGERAYAELAARLLPACRALGLQLMLDRDPALVTTLGAAGWHARSEQLAALRGRPLPPPLWCAASVHDAAQLEQAGGLGADFLVLGAVLPTATHPGGGALGWPAFAALLRQANRPVYAIGGVGPAAQAEAQAHYAQGTAGISAYWRVPSS